MSDSVLVIGGGIAGTRAALDLAHAGARVVLVETKATLGGKMASILEEEITALDLPQAGRMPSITAAAKHANIEVLTMSDVVGLSGEPGEFTATIRQRQRFVSHLCDQCNGCRQVCPVVQPNEYDAGLSFRKAIFSPLRNAVPATYVVDIETCLNDPPNYIPCQRCVEECHVHAIRFDQPLVQTLTRVVGSVVVAAGFDLVDVSRLQEYGYGAHPDVVTSMELERLFAASGTTGGFVQKPSNEQDPERVLIVICDNTLFTWTYSGRHTGRLLDQAIEHVSVLYAEAPGNGALPTSFLRSSVCDKVRMLPGRLTRIQGDSEGILRVEYTPSAASGPMAEDFDLVVLATAVRPSEGLGKLAENLGIKLGPDGFVRTMEKDGDRVATSRAGIYATGCVAGPKNIPESIIQTTAAVKQALQHLGHRFQTAPLPAAAPAQPAPAPEPAPALAAVAPVTVAAEKGNGSSEAAAAGPPTPDSLRPLVDYVVQLLISLGERDAAPRSPGSNGQ